MSYQRYDNLLIGKDLGELDHPPEILLREPAAELPRSNRAANEGTILSPCSARFSLRTSRRMRSPTCQYSSVSPALTA
jgi:hypothetical protein